jgi:hypothetical protein
MHTWIVTVSGCWPPRARLGSVFMALRDAGFKCMHLPPQPADLYRYQVRHIDPSAMTKFVLVKHMDVWPFEYEVVDD